MCKGLCRDGDGSICIVGQRQLPWLPPAMTFRGQKLQEGRLERGGSEEGGGKGEGGGEREEGRGRRGEGGGGEVVSEEGGNRKKKSE